MLLTLPALQSIRMAHQGAPLAAAATEQVLTVSISTLIRCQSDLVRYSRLQLWASSDGRGVGGEAQPWLTPSMRSSIS